MTTKEAVVTAFADRAAWLAGRRAGLGSSDAAAVLGLSRFKSPLALHYEKTGEDVPPPIDEDAVYWGLELEEPMAKRFKREMPNRVVLMPGKVFGGDPTGGDADGRLVLARDADDPRLVATPDRIQFLTSLDPSLPGIEPGMPGILELKNVHISHADDWTDEPPLEYQVQVQHQMMVTGLRWGSIAALIGGFTFKYADVLRDEAFIAKLRQAEVEFLDAVERGDPPAADGTSATKAVLARLYPKDTGEIVTLPPDALDWHAQLVSAKKAIKAAEAEKLEAENALKAALEDASVGTLPDGTTYSWRYQKRSAHLVAESEFRVLRHHGGRK